MGGIDAIDARYSKIVDRAHEVLGSDDRVRSVEVRGSVATGSADAWSDLDLAVIAEPDGYDELLADWPRWLGDITPTVFARTPIAPMIINAITVDGLVLDVVVHRGELFEFPAPTEHTVGLGGPRFADLGDALEHAVVEQLRSLAGPFVSCIGRGDHIRAMLGVPHLLGLLTTVFLAETGGAPPGKRMNESFTAEQLETLAALPPVAANRESSIAFTLAAAETMLGRARVLFPRYELEWPAPLAAATASRLAEALDIDASAWLR